MGFGLRAMVSDWNLRRFARRMINAYGADALRVSIDFATARRSAGEYLAASLWIAVAGKITYMEAPDRRALKAALAAMRPFLDDPHIKRRLDRSSAELGLSAEHVLVDLGVRG